VARSHKVPQDRKVCRCQTPVARKGAREADAALMATGTPTDGIAITGQARAVTPLACEPPGPATQAFIRLKTAFNLAPDTPACRPNMQDSPADYGPRRAFVPRPLPTFPPDRAWSAGPRVRVARIFTTQEIAATPGVRSRAVVTYPPQEV